MANKSKITSKSEAEKVVADFNQEEKIRERRRKVIKRINDLMESAGLVSESKDGKRKFYQAGFQEAFGINRSTTSLYYNLKKDVPIETLLKIFNHEKINCSLDYLLLKSDAVNYAFDDVIKRTGLSEEAIDVLIDKKNEFGDIGIGSFTDTLNYLITEGGALIEAIVNFRDSLSFIKDSRKRLVDRYDLSEEIVSEALELYGGLFLMDPSVEIEVFSSFLNRTNASAVLSGEKPRERQLNDEEIFSLYEYCKRVTFTNIRAAKLECNEQLIKFLTAIEADKS